MAKVIQRGRPGVLVATKPKDKKRHGRFFDLAAHRRFVQAMLKLKDGYLLD